MPGRYLLDTNAVIALFADDEDLVKTLGQADAVFLSIVVLGELYFGAEKSHRVEENVAQVESLAADSTVLFVDTEIAREYGRVKQQLKSRGRPIPENDVWIAATALTYGLLLVTRDRHFDGVPGLELDDWR